jgi:hypothetical protein
VLQLCLKAEWLNFHGSNDRKISLRSGVDSRQFMRRYAEQDGKQFPAGDLNWRKR